MPLRRALSLSASGEELLEFIASCEGAPPREELFEKSILPPTDLLKDLQAGRVLIYQDPESGHATSESYNARMFLFNSRERIYFLELSRIYNKSGTIIEIPNDPLLGLFSSSETCEVGEVDRNIRPYRLANPVATLKRMCIEEWDINPDRIPNLDAVVKRCEWYEETHRSSVFAGVWSKKQTYTYFVDEPIQVSRSFKRLLLRKDGSKTLKRECFTMDASMDRYVSEHTNWTTY